VLQRDPARSTRDLMSSLPEHPAQMERDRVRADDPGRHVAAARRPPLPPRETAAGRFLD